MDVEAADPMTSFVVLHTAMEKDCHPLLDQGVLPLAAPAADNDATAKEVAEHYKQSTETALKCFRIRSAASYNFAALLHASMRVDASSRRTLPKETPTHPSASASASSSSQEAAGSSMMLTTTTTMTDDDHDGAPLAVDSRVVVKLPSQGVSSVSPAPAPPTRPSSSNPFDDLTTAGWLRDWTRCSPWLLLALGVATDERTLARKEGVMLVRVMDTVKRETVRELSRSCYGLIGVEEGHTFWNLLDEGIGDDDVCRKCFTDGKLESCSRCFRGYHQLCGKFLGNAQTKLCWFCALQDTKHPQRGPGQRVRSSLLADRRQAFLDRFRPTDPNHVVALSAAGPTGSIGFKRPDPYRVN
eukprot:GHVU01168001.1.p1 GENE.GHVU01168001.1~~GHVU01168001.1.p1  ORF type:complete len:356 (+),score=71.37 GHVU01168001.1:239-1306(+)